MTSQLLRNRALTLIALWVIVLPSLPVFGLALAQDSRPWLLSGATTASLDGSATPGGVAVVRIDVGELGQPVARFGNRELLVVYRQGRWYALVGLSSTVLPGNYVVNTFSDKGDTDSEEFAILARAPNLPSGQRRQPRAAKATPADDDKAPGPWQIPGTRHVEAGESIRVNGSIRPLDTANLTTYSTATPNLDLSPVTESLALIPYGALLDASRMRRHDYISYQTRAGAQVYAPAAGKVRAIIDDDRGRKTLYLDHGEGLISVIGNLQKALVVADQIVQRGEQLATAGAGPVPDTGTVDWGLQMNGWLVDPSVVSRIGLALRAEEVAAPVPD